MWRWGFTLWRAWVWLRIAAPAGLALWLAWHAWGASTRFAVAVLVVGGIAVGAWFVLADLARHELGNRGRSRSHTSVRR